MKQTKAALWLSIAVLALTLSACGNNNNGAMGPEPTSAEQEHTADAAHGAHWSYTGDTGPEHWGELDPANAACVNGQEQSPVDIEIADVQADSALEDVQINYQPSTVAIVNNGHTIQANVVSPANTIKVEGVEYKLAQFHFHLPSEHQFDGKNFDMEVHFVHKNEKGDIAVIGIMLKAGAANTALEELWSKLPKEETKEEIKLDQPIDLLSLLPQDKATFRYNGSLTTPPCSEPVKWMVMEQSMEMSREQIEAFAAIFPDNHRPVQPLNDRVVKSDK